MNELEDAKQKAATTYNAASGYYDHPANTFWGCYGRSTVERLGLAAAIQNRHYKSYRTYRNHFSILTHPTPGYSLSSPACKSTRVLLNLVNGMPSLLGEVS